MVCVRPGVLLVNASFLWPVRALIKLDLPTLLLPKNATSGNRSEGNVSGLPELTTNSAFKELIQYLGRGFASPGGDMPHLNLSVQRSLRRASEFRRSDPPPESVRRRFPVPGRSSRPGPWIPRSAALWSA